MAKSSINNDVTSAKRDANFDPVKVAHDIIALDTDCEKQKAAILFDVQQHHPEHLDEVCRLACIGRSRRKELLQIGSGRKSIEQSRAEGAARHDKLARRQSEGPRLRRKRKQRRLPPPPRRPSVTAQSPRSRPPSLRPNAPNLSRRRGSRRRQRRGSRRRRSLINGRPKRLRRLVR
jgi:hypothetical protein